MVYKQCIIRCCKNTTLNQSKKIFLTVPKDPDRRRKWCEIVNLNYGLYQSNLFICEDHFDLAEDAENWSYYRMAGNSIILKKDAVPHRNLTGMAEVVPESQLTESDRKTKADLLERTKNMPKDKQQPRTQSRRAASKEALKQMHLLLGDEKRYEISSDDDVIAVEVEPPKKKYKLSHRKSSDGNDRDVIVLKTVEDGMFDLEVVVEELAPCQQSRHEQFKKETQEVDAKIEQLRSAPNTEVVYNGVFSTALEISEQVQSIVSSASSSNQYTITSQANPLPSTPQQPVPSQSIVLQQQSSGNNSMPQSYQLVMDPRLGVIVGTVSTAPNATPNTPPLQLYQPKVTIPSTAPNNSEQPAMKTRRGTILRQVGNSMPPLHKTTSTTTTTMVQKGPTTTMVQKGPTTTMVQKGPPLQNKQNKTLQVKSVKQMVQTKQVLQTKTLTPKPLATMKARTPANTTQPVPPYRPTESSVEGGLSMGKPTKSIDLTSEDGRALPDSREVSFNKLQGRTYPSLVVVARPHLRVKDLAADRGKLDVKVKSVLMYAPTKFTEWLIQQGLVRSDQKCSVHTSNALKLGMYSDASKFPYSGGYVWISECCPQRFVSVFSGSLFEGSQHPPMAILKLLYHWCCQTIVQNVTQWVKVDNLYVKGMYTWLRSICTVALHTHIKQLGGAGVKVQVGVISLGTTSQDGNKREVKVEVLGILETTTRHIRLRAVEPLADGERNYKKRFTKILEPVFNWVHPSSIIVTDLTVDKATLHQMGFLHVTQSTSTDYAQSNRTIMEYLRRIVPRMFQNTLSLLSRQIIQQFLDELVWREWYGTTVLQSFENMVQHLSEQTRYDSGQSLIVRLNKVSANPFKNWSIPVTGTTAAPPATPKVTEVVTPKRYSRQRKPTTPLPLTTPVVQDVMRPAKSTSPDVPEQMVPLENYYYGTITPPPVTRNKVTINIKCPFCKLNFNSNITLMNHLFKHAHNVSNDVQLCKYCLTIVPTGNDLLKHIGTAHPDETKFDNGFVCLICEAHFRNPFILGKHMSKEHCPSELPYLCGTCNFRCSNHKQAVDHFYQQHDYGTTIQCPFCLKATTIFSGGRNISQNMNYFIQHLQKHQKKNLAKRCGRCTLWFIQKEFLKDHQGKMHISQRGKSGLVPCFAPRNGVMVPKSKMDKCPDDAKVINFSTLYFNVGKNLLCKECNISLSTPKHFASFESCQNPNCQFSTFCSSSMRDHVAKCKFLNSKLPAEKLPYEMHCICGYSDVYGNQMAKHLAICERKSAYPSKDAAKDATVTHSMLDVLGLVRKPDEATTSTKETPKRFEGGASVQPIILKRGRPRKHPIKEIGAAVGQASEVAINISDVRGGVECTDVNEEKGKEVKGKIDLTEDSNEETVKDSAKKKDEVIEEKKENEEQEQSEIRKEEELTEVASVNKEAVTESKEQPENEQEEKDATENKKQQEKEAVTEIEVVERENSEGEEHQEKDTDTEKEVSETEEQQEEAVVENEDRQVKEVAVENEATEMKEVVDEETGIKEVEGEDTEIKEVGDEDTEIEEVGDEDTEIKEVGDEDTEIKEVGDEDTGMKEVEDKDTELKEVEAEEAPQIDLTEVEEPQKSVGDDEERRQEISEIEERLSEEQPEKEIIESETQYNETPSEVPDHISEQLSAMMGEGETMEVDSCNNMDAVDNVAIEKNLDEVINDICPMDTD